MRQSRVMSMVEAAANVVVGYVLAIATQIVVFPWFGIEAALGEHLAIGLIFVGVSLAGGTCCGGCLKHGGAFEKLQKEGGLVAIRASCEPEGKSRPIRSSSSTLAPQPIAGAPGSLG